MAYTYPPPYYETPSAPTDTHAAFKDFATFLNGTHATQSNPAGWPCVECWDGTTRLVPSGGSLANLPGGNLWKPGAGTPPQNAWAVFQAPGGGDVVARYQVYLEMHTFQAAFLGMFQLNDWVVGAGTDSNPTIPATSLGVPPFTNDVDGTFANHNDYLWRAWVDEGGFMISAFPTAAGSTEWMYVGDLDADNPASVDPRPFVISRNPDAPGWQGAYYCISPVDDTTNTLGVDEIEQQFAVQDVDDQDAFTARSICSVATYILAVGNRYRKGKFRNCGAISRHTRTATDSDRITAGTGPTSYDYEIWGRGGTNANIVTRYPPGTSLPDGHEEITAASIPEQL